MFDENLYEEEAISILIMNISRVKRNTSGCPLGSTLGPCKLWQLTISTSSGRCFSKAAISGALHDVCPPTIAPNLVAIPSQRCQHGSLCVL